jgi:GH25 family lysozyme M1 (1,4-beta-N-acetylmuramidase)
MTNYQNLSYKVIGPDTSHWEGRMDVSKTVAAGARFIIPKAGPGNGSPSTDNQFHATWNSARGVLRRSAFWWLTINTSIRQQAKDFAALLRNDPGEIEPYVDFEEGRQFWVRRNPVTNRRGWNQIDVSHLSGFITYFHQEFPVWPWKNDIGIYTGLSYWQERGSKKAEWAKYPLWFSEPDPVPAPFLPEPWTTWKFWQTDFAADGILFGTDPLQAKGVDMNVHNGTLEQFEAEYPAFSSAPIPVPVPTPTPSPTPTPIPAPQPSTISHPYDGVEYRLLRRFDSDCHAIIIDPTKRKVVIPNYGMKLASEVAAETDALIVVNGGDHNTTTGRPVGLFVYGGVKATNQVEYEPYLSLDKNGGVSLREWNQQPLYGAIALKRFIVFNSQLWPAHTSPAWSTVDPRTLFGVTQDGKLIICVVDGRSQTSKGITLMQAADLMMELGAYRAGDGDGGKSSALWIGGKIVNTPSEGEIKVGTHVAIK